MKSLIAGFVFVLAVGFISAIAPAADRVFRLGLCHVGLDHTPPHLPSMRETLASLGYVDGRNLRLDFRNLPDEAAARETMQAFIREHVDLIVAFEDICPQAARSLVKDIPVVMTGATDTVRLGLVESLARPGGNITGFESWIVSPGKEIEIFKEVFPGLRRLIVLYDPSDRAMPEAQRDIRAAAIAKSIDLDEHLASSADDIERVFQHVVAQDATGVLIAGTTLRNKFPSLILRHALDRKLPIAMHRRALVLSGALFSYNANPAANGPRIAAYIDRILKGTKPADLPIERPTTIELVINLKTAKALGLTVPEAILARADEVIE